MRDGWILMISLLISIMMLLLTSKLMLNEQKGLRIYGLKTSSKAPYCFIIFRYLLHVRMNSSASVSVIIAES